MKRWPRKLTLFQLQQQEYPFSSEELDLLQERLTEEMEYESNIYIKEWEQEYFESKKTKKWSLM